MIQSLPGIDATEEEQVDDINEMKELQSLDDENLLAEKELGDAIREAEELRDLLKSSVESIIDQHTNIIDT